LALIKLTHSPETGGGSARTGTYFILASMVSALELQTIPQAQTVHEGERAQFSVTVSGKGPFTYTWFWNGAQVDNSASADPTVFTTPQLKIADNNDAVICMITDATNATVTTSAVKVTVLPVSSKTMTLEGDLTLVTGDKDFDVDLMVLLFDHLDGDRLVYQETFAAAGRGSVPVRNGRFQVRLGMSDGGESLQQVVQTNKSLYVEFRPGLNGTYEQMKPRLPLTAFPYALSATHTGE